MWISRRTEARRAAEHTRLVQEIVDYRADAARAKRTNAELKAENQRLRKLDDELTRLVRARDSQAEEHFATIGQLATQLDERDTQLETIRSVAESNKRAYAGAIEEIDRLREKLNHRAAAEAVTFDRLVEVVARDLYRTEHAVPRNDDDRWDEQDGFERDCWRENATSVLEALGRVGALVPTEPASDLAPLPAAPNSLGAAHLDDLRTVRLLTGGEFFADEILPPHDETIPVSRHADPERLDAAMHSRDTYAQRQAANTRLVHEEAVAVQRDVAARLSTQALPCGCLPGYECRCEVKA